MWKRAWRYFVGGLHDRLNFFLHNVDIKMPAFDFRKNFIPMILSGQKISTIRSTQRCRVGDVMYLYTGMRTKTCKLIVEKTCVLMRRVILEKNCVSYVAMDDKKTDSHLTQESLQRFADEEGFKDWLTTKAFFEGFYGELPYTGFRHWWGDN